MTEYPNWWRNDGGWYEAKGDKTRYCVWDELDEDSIVFEVGAHNGAWTRRMAEKYACHIHAFEPAPLAYQKAKKHIGAASKVYLHNVALWMETGEFELGDSQRDGASLLKDIEPIVKVKAVEVGEFIETHDIEHIDLMSINIEGGEFKLIPHMIDISVIDIIDRLMIQPHYFMDGDLGKWLEIGSKLAQTHRMIWNYSAWEAWEKHGLAPSVAALCYV